MQVPLEWQQICKEPKWWKSPNTDSLYESGTAWRWILDWFSESLHAVTGLEDGWASKLLQFKDVVVTVDECGCHRYALVLVPGVWSAWVWPCSRVSPG